MEKGKVYLVGAGPGDPGLITLKGLHALQQAQVVVYDRLVEKDLLKFAPRGAELIYAGKARGERAFDQEEISRTLIEKAREGKIVARLKGGDPFVLGRGGEEAEALARARVPFEVVPGVSSATAVPAYAGIPITHRDFASSFAVITGQEGKGKYRIDWGRLAGGADTLVFLMGVENLSRIARELIRHGRPPTTPSALIQWGTRPQQKTITTSLKDIARSAKKENFGPPSVLVVGEVVNLRPLLSWFEKKPLLGKRVLVTRPPKEASRLSALLVQEGAVPVEVPTIETYPAPSLRLDRALDRLEEYDWVVFTSPRGVEAFFERLFARGKDARALGQARLLAIGPATEEALRGYGLRPDLVPREYATQGIVREMAPLNLKGTCLLLPRTDMAGEELGEELRSLGARVEQVTAYRTRLRKEKDIQKKVKEIDIVAFTSASTVQGLFRALGGSWKALAGAHVACIGPQTAAAARGLGLKVDIEAREHTIPGLVGAIVKYYQGKGEG
jgi:uroporphyrinogen III methyltransferase/synthase